MSMGVTVEFSYSAWAQAYPEFSNVTQNQAIMFWNEATIYCRNDGCGPVSSETTQSFLLNLLTAHIAMLRVGTAANPVPAPVGRISDASEGSVSVSTELPTMPTAAAWFSQTQYGLSYWTATAPYRTMRYLPNVGRFGPNYGGLPWGSSYRGPGTW